MSVVDARRPTAAAPRVEGPDKVTGRARYAADQPLADLAHAWPVAATVVRGRVRTIHADEVRALPGVLAVLGPGHAPRLEPTAEAELALFQSPEVAYRGQWVAAVVATTAEVARHAAEALRVEVDARPHDVTLRSDHPGLYAPPKVNAGFATDSEQGDVEAALAAAAVVVDETYTTPTQHNNPMEPHATTAVWDGDRLTVWDSNQGPGRPQQVLAQLFGLDPTQVRVRAGHVGGGFGAKARPKPNLVLAALAARVVGRPVRCAVPRSHMFAVAGHRTPTIQRVRLGADAGGRITAVVHEVAEQSSTLEEFAEQTAVATRHMYAGPNRRTTHRLVRLDVPTPGFMRAPGETPGMFALESAVDELALACGLDPVELRVRNEPEVDPETGRPWSSRNLVACLRQGAARFGWAGRDPRPGGRRDGRWLVGTGVASSLYPARVVPSSARASVDEDGRYEVAIAASDIGTGARTVLGLVAAEALDVAPGAVTVRLGDSDLPPAMLAGGSMGTTSWSWAVIAACRSLRDRLDERAGVVPPGGLGADASTREAVAAGRAEVASFAFGAQFAEARVDVDTGEVRVPRLLGVFAAGRILNATAARSQLVGGMTMGLSMALHEESPLDPVFGDFPHHDLAGYHVAAHADVVDVEAVCLDEDEPHLGPAGAKGLGEIGIVGTAAAVANAVHHATGVRVRDLPLRLDRLLR